MNSARETITAACDECGSPVERKIVWSNRPVYCKACYHRLRQRSMHLGIAESQRVQQPRYLYRCEVCGADVIFDTVKLGIILCSGKCRVARGATDAWHQRNAPVNEWEQIAIDEYARRGCSCLWMPHQCEFDFVVNGHRVDVKGSSIVKSQPGGSARFAFELANSGSGHGKEDLTERCDYYHLIGRDNEGDIHHYIVPSAVAVGRTQIAIPVTTGRCSWAVWNDAWEFLDRGVNAVAAMAQMERRLEARREQERTERAEEIKREKARQQRQIAQQKEDNAALGARLREMRERAGVSGTVLSSAMGLSRAAVYHIETGRLPTTNHKHAYIAALHALEPQGSTIPVDLAVQEALQ